MFTFPSFKSSEIYPLYIKQCIGKWESLQWKIVCLIILLELARIIEDGLYPSTVWETLMRNKGIAWISYFLGLVVRRLVFKKIKHNKEGYLFVTDLLYLIVIVSFFVIQYSMPASAKTPPPIWLGKESVRFFACNFIVSTSFFHWYFQALVLLAVVLTNASYLIKYGGQVGIFLPSYLTLVLCAALYLYNLEKTKRHTFESEYQSLQNEKLWKNILTEFPEGVLIVNHEKNVIHMNSAVNTVLSLPVNTKIRSLMDINDKVSITVENFTQKYFSTEGSESSEFDEPVTLSFDEFQSKLWAKWDKKNYDYMHQHINLRASYKFEGKVRLFELKFALRRFAGNIVALFIMSDITERVLIDSLKQNLEYKNRLLASVSHELRTPLNANINFIDSAIRESQTPAKVVNKYLLPAQKSAKYLLMIINDIVDYSQIQTDKLRLNYTNKSIVQTLRECISLIEMQAMIKGLQVNLEIPQENWDPEIKTDHIRVMQIVVNLLSNALKFTFSGKITVRIKPEIDEIYTIEVEDTGIGIKSEDKYKIIKGPDYQEVESPGYTNNQGFGMGLTISEAIAKLLLPRSNILISVSDQHRALKFESELDRGSKFWFRIEDQNSRTTSPYFFIPGEEKRTIAIPDFKIISLIQPVERACCCPPFLIADDDPFNLSCLENIITSLGHAVDGCYNGKEVLELLSNRISNPCSPGCKPYQLIFLDCNMPIMDGYTCMKNLLEIFQVHPQFRCPVVACTAAVQDSERVKVLECGMNDFCPKPITRNVVKQTIEKFQKTRKNTEEHIVFELHSV